MLVTAAVSQRHFVVVDFVSVSLMVFAGFLCGCAASDSLLFGNHGGVDCCMNRMSACTRSR